MARSKKPPIWSPVAIERDGKAYSGRFNVDRRLITVLYNNRTKPTQLVDRGAIAIACHWSRNSYLKHELGIPNGSKLLRG